MNKKSKGAISNILLILGVMILVLAVVIFVVIKSTGSKKTTTSSSTDTSNTSGGPTVPQPVYDTTVGDVRFIFESAKDVGSVLKSPDPRFQPDLKTTERFIKVVIGAQNKGKTNVIRDSWGVGNIVDSEGRNFVAVDQDNQAYYFSNNSTTNPNLCGVLLKPAFEPTPCVKYYEVSKASTGLKVQVHLSGAGGGISSKKQESYLDLNVK